MVGHDGEHVVEHRGRGRVLAAQRPETFGLVSGGFHIGFDLGDTLKVLFFGPFPDADQMIAQSVDEYITGNCRPFSGSWLFE